MPETSRESSFYFIGVTTGQSSIMRVFPKWMEELGFPETRIIGCDIEPRGPREEYRKIVRCIKEEPSAKGALVTTHKIDILQAAYDCFDSLDEYARVFGEVSCISKKRGLLHGYAKDPISAGLALEAFLPKDYWANHPGAYAFIMGAGGSGLALSVYFIRRNHGINVPAKIILSNRGIERLDHARHVHNRIGRTTQVKYIQVAETTSNDDIIGGLPEESLVVNATGMGKDRPGSPLSDGVLFPENGYAWEFNYRGDLDFLHQAERQRESRGLTIEDGRIYFIHGWTLAIAEVFGIALSKEVIERFSAVFSQIALNRS
jgi:shikimate dehydrogenase